MATYKPPTYDDAKYRRGLNGAGAYYDTAIANYTAQAEKQRATQLGEAQKTQQSALKSAYISRVQNAQQMDKSLATAGIRGGATETSNLRLANMYGNAVNAANTDYTNSVNSINQAIDQNIADYRSDMESRKEGYIQNLAQARWQAEREDYANRFNAQREDAANKYERQQAEIARQTEYWSNYYTNKYSGYSKKDVKKTMKAVKKKMKAAKTAYERIKWQQALAALGARQGVIANG